MVNNHTRVSEGRVSREKITESVEEWEDYTLCNQSYVKSDRFTKVVGCARVSLERVGRKCLSPCTNGLLSFFLRVRGRNVIDESTGSRVKSFTVINPANVFFFY